MDVEMQPYVVYIKTDAQNRINAVNSSSFLRDADGWIEIDKGFDDRCHHAQANYFPNTLRDRRGIMRYMTAPIADYPDREVYHVYERNGEQWGIYERTQAEMDADYIPPTQPVDPKDQKIAQLEDQVAALSAAFLQL